MAGLSFKLEQRPNAEHMSPLKTVPFLKMQNVLVAEFGPIVEFVAKKVFKIGKLIINFLGFNAYK